MCEENTMFLSAAGRFIGRSLSIDDTITLKEIKEGIRKIKKIGYDIILLDRVIKVLNESKEVFVITHANYKSYNRAIIATFGKFQTYYNKL